MSLEFILQVAPFLGAGVASFLYMKKNMSNGDGRSLRQAVDDMASDAKEHRSETRQQLDGIHERLGAMETRMDRVEHGVTTP